MAAADQPAVFFQPMSPAGERRRSFCETLIRIRGRTPRTSLWSEQHRQKMRIASQMATAELQQLPICPRTPSRARQLVHESPPATLHGFIFCGLW